MRRCLRWTLLFLLIFSAAASAEQFRFVSDAYPGLYDRELSVTYERVHSGSGGTLLLMDEAGYTLGSVKVGADKDYGTIRIGITADMPIGQTLRLYLQKGDELILQDECLLAADAAKRDGLRRVETDEKKIAITFDSASGVGKLYSLLDLLDKYGVKCTFFLQGEMIRSYPEAATEIYTRGHELANHSMFHPNMKEASDQTIYNEITRCNARIEAITGKPVTLYRPPSGYYTYRDRAIGRALGCEMILWTFDSMDGFTDSTYNRVWKAMTTKSAPGSIILMHIYGKHTLTVLDAYIPMMQEQGYEFVTVTDLMLPGGVLDSEGVMRLPETASES